MSYPIENTDRSLSSVNLGEMKRKSRKNHSQFNPLLFLYRWDLGFTGIQYKNVVVSKVTV